MTQITATTQLSLFSLIRSAIKANSTLAVKFSDKNIFQFEPKQKALDAVGYPYIWINVPSTDSAKLVFNNSVVPKELDVDLYLRVEWMARDNFLNYANAIISALEAYESTFQSSGYYDVMCEMVDIDSNQVIDQKEIVEGVFRVRFHGQVAR